MSSKLIWRAFQISKNKPQGKMLCPGWFHIGGSVLPNQRKFEFGLNFFLYCKNFQGSVFQLISSLAFDTIPCISLSPLKLHWSSLGDLLNEKRTGILVIFLQKLHYEGTPFISHEKQRFR